MSQTIDLFRLAVGSDDMLTWCAEHGLDPKAIAVRDVLVDDDGLLHLFQYDLPRRIDERTHEVVGHEITVRPKRPIPVRR